MARVLLVGCGCRGRELAARLVSEGYAVRGTTRSPGRLQEIEAAGADGAIADPDRVGTVMAQLEGVGVVCWLMGSALAEPGQLAALHGPRLESLLEALVDTPVRGFVYEAAGSVDAGLLERGADAAQAAGRRSSMPVEVASGDPADRAAWASGAATAVGRVLGR